MNGGIWSGRIGRRDALCDVAGLSVGHARAAEAPTGATVILPDQFCVAAVDVRGGGPATRETDLLRSGATVRGAHAISLSGGSVFGLAAADGVVETLCAAGVGLRPAPAAPPVPIVPGAAIYDLKQLGLGSWEPLGGAPYRALGAAALAAARVDDACLGAVGAGVGARAGDGPGGLGQASFVVAASGQDGPTVAALVIANPVGAPLEPGETLFDLDMASDPLPQNSKLAGAPIALNTCLVVAATDADLTAEEATRFAVMAQDGLARAVRPSHTPYDGDVVFALATGGFPLPYGAGASRLMALTVLGSAAADCVSRALLRGVEAGRRAAERNAGG
ncbi:MAG: P1 family peptidase [Neomegalonema sp.]|nr:P1 family peptidase [Neomegalonema sp.]